MCVCLGVCVSVVRVCVCVSVGDKNGLSCVCMYV